MLCLLAMLETLRVLHVLWSQAAGKCAVSEIVHTDFCQGLEM